MPGATGTFLETHVTGTEGHRMPGATGTFLESHVSHDQRRVITFGSIRTRVGYLRR
jgi:hypothetical protein